MSLRSLASELLEEMNSRTSDLVAGLVAMELSGSFTVNRREFEKSSQQHLNALRLAWAGEASGHAAIQNGGGDKSNNKTKQQHRHQPSDQIPAAVAAAAALQSNVTAAAQMLNTVALLSSSDGSGMDQLVPPASLRRLPASATAPDQLLSMMATTLTYFTVSCHRISDGVPLHIMYYLVNGFTSNFRAALGQELLALTSDQIVALLAEDGTLASRRAALVGQKNILEKALRTLRAVA